MDNYFIKKNHKLIACIVHGIRYAKLNGVNGFRLIIEINNKRLKTNKIYKITSLSELYNLKDKLSKRLLIKEYENFKVEDFILFYDNDAKLIHSLNRNCNWNDNNLNYINNIGKIVSTNTINGIKIFTVKFNSNFSINLLSNCLIKISDNIKYITKN
jgi:hypothetical protein